MICRRYGEIPDNTAGVENAKFVRLQSELVDYLENQTIRSRRDPTRLMIPNQQLAEQHQITK